MSDSPLNKAIRIFETAEANIVKLENIWKEMVAVIPDGTAFIEDSGYDNNYRDFNNVWDALPKIDDWKPEICLMSLNDIGQSRLDAMELGEPECHLFIEKAIFEPGRLIEEYRYKFERKRQELVRDKLQLVVDSVDESLRDLATELESSHSTKAPVVNPRFDDLTSYIAEVDTLLGSDPRPSKWSDLQRHLSFGLLCDLQDIIQIDWPSVKNGIRQSLYKEKEPIPVEVEDLGALVSTKPSGPIAKKLNWEKLTPDEFERIIFVLISSEKGYENPGWLTKTNAPDRGRDLSVSRIHNDSLGGVLRQRVIIQCKRWSSQSVSVSDVGKLKEQMKLWEPPKIDVHVIATTGWFTSDAVASIEKHNQSDSGLRIEMWNGSHLERLLSSRPHLIAEFGLR